MNEWKKLECATWEAFRKGDKQAYSLIYREYYPRLYTYGSKFTNNDSVIEDSLQEIFAGFWFNRQKLQGVEKMETYLFVSFRNRLIKGLNQLAHNKSQLSSYNHLGFDFELSVEQIMINAERLYEQQISLKSSVDQLTERQKEVIYLKFYEDLSYEEIAQILNISTKATYKLLARSISQIRSAYQLKFASLMFSFPLPFLVITLSLQFSYLHYWFS